VTAAQVLALVLEAGGRVVPDTDPPRILVPRRLRPLVEAHRAELRELVRGAARPIAANTFPWPDSLAGLGVRTLVAFTRCSRCRPTAHPAVAGTFAAYGSVPLCLRHALALEEARA
jgi:hypothetical protein